MIGLAIMQSITGCPTCLGRLELQSPTFFSDELYQLDPEDDVHYDAKNQNQSTSFKGNADKETEPQVPNRGSAQFVGGDSNE